MNYQDYIKYDPEKKQYTDSYGYVIDGVSSKALPSEQRAQQPAKANRITLIDTDTGVDPIIQASGGDSTNLILDAKGLVKTTKALVVGTSNTNQAWITTGANSVSLVAAGADAPINVDLTPSSGGNVRFAKNYSKYITIMGSGNNKITASQGTHPDGDLTLESKGAGKLILANDNNGNTFETLEIVHANGSSTITAKNQFTGTYPNGDINFVSRGSTGKIIFANSGGGIPEKLELLQANGSTTLTATTSGGATSGDIILVPRGLGVVNCASYMQELNTGMMSTQTLGTNVNTKVRFDNSIFNNFPAGFITKPDLGGAVYDTFQNTSGRTIALMVTACIRETTYPTGRTLGLWIARTGDSSLQYGQALLPPTTDTTNGRALNTASIIKLAHTESFSIWAHTAVDGVVIGGNGSLYNRPILSYRLMP